MKVLSLLNAIIVPVKRDGYEYYFFLDSGFPGSFSTEVDQITEEDLDLNFEYVHEVDAFPIQDMLETLTQMMQ